ncbi:branched-chain amino acid ABC transporter permease [Salinigranum halophilum]|jgi:branched-chain amino acid transport system permease protein|uniref:branched-chain amino acid ABC transporter permease n=1 Tax=Salinigranum halophilum TaxID=2565931 RepID=UPI00115E57FD|nr:branched-chain amino acid ABC transporter permease [Salinigranum halophilum]
MLTLTLPLITPDDVVGPLSEFVQDVVTLDPVLLQLGVFAVLLGGVFALAALGLTLIFGVMDVVNFAHGMLIVTGMYTVFFLTTTFGVNPFLAIPVAVAFLFVVGVVISVTSIEPIIEAPQENQFIVTLGLTFILLAIIQIIFTGDPRSIALDLGRIDFYGALIPRGQLYALALAVVAMAGLWVFLQKTELGTAIRATADNRDGAWYVGINVPHIDHLTVGIGSALAGLAGSAIVIFSPFDPFIGESYLVKAFVIVVLGGLGSFPGALVGGLIVGFIQVFGGFYLPGTVNEVLIFVLFVLLLYLKPTGLFGAREV